MDKNALLVAVLAVLLLGCGPTPEPTAAPRATAVPSSATPGPTKDPPLGDTKIRPADGMVMVYVPAGEFEMGSAEGTPYADDDEFPQHTVYLDAFWIDRTEVSNAQYRECVEAGVCDEPGCWDNTDFNVREQPVVCVDWHDAQAYCEWAGGRLPTEAEWEYAARGPEGSIYPWGDGFDGERLNYCDANCEFDWKDTTYDDGYARTAPVGSYPNGASWCGALDLAGNVWEWGADWYDKDYYARSPSENPQGPGSGYARVLRGGSWYYSRRFVRSVYRGGVISTVTGALTGFRCVMSAQ